MTWARFRPCVLFCVLASVGPLLSPLATGAAAWQGPGATPSVPPPPEEPPTPEAAERPPDPFADLGPADTAQSSPPTTPSWRQRLWGNSVFRREVASQIGATGWSRGASRQSVGFELQRKFSSATATRASLDIQGRLVRRDGLVPMPNDMEGAERPGWTFEYHNAYLDLYDVFHPLLSDDRRRRYVGRFNARAGRFYVPFGLNLQTDTHGTVLQLSNERNFGFERDWYSGIWGALNRNLDYGVYYLLGSGYDPAFKGQRGLAAARISLSNRYLSDYGWEGGISGMGGERLVSSRDRRATATAVGVSEQGRAEGDLAPVETQRLGVDARYRRPVPRGLLTGTSEISGGRDASDGVLSQLYQAEYLHASRRWGLAGQYRRFRHGGLGTDVSLAGDAAWYFRNDVGSSNLHWVRINVERQLERMNGSRGVVVMLQYYVYL